MDIFKHLDNTLPKYYSLGYVVFHEDAGGDRITLSKENGCYVIASTGHNRIYLTVRTLTEAKKVYKKNVKLFSKVL
jgi:hypothetical protein